MDILAHISASTSWVDSTQRRLSNCKWHRNPSKCNDAPGCFHNGTKCIIDISRITEFNCGVYDRKRRMCGRHGCYFDTSTRKCFTLTEAPTPMPFLPSIETASPSKHLTSAAPSLIPSVTSTTLEPSVNPSAAPATSEPSFSPSASFTQAVVPSFSPSYLVTPKPTLLRRSQDYCGKYHKKPRRCINRGCLFDSTTLQCTNGVPTATPSTSPSAFPSMSQQPTNTPYRVRLYWEQGYKWQEDPAEKWFCWACAQCKPCTETNQDRTPDCVDLLCDVKHHCSAGMSIAVTDCELNLSSDKSAEFSFLPGHSGLFDNDFKGGQIQVHNTNLCLSQSGIRSIELETCDASKIEQSFLGFQPDEGAMELSPANITMEDGKVVDQCITNHHHPRAGERIYSEKCSRARRSDTSLWDLWTAY
mmetsp:Transcript_12865/g.25886  ORF Transcript_12865/g.25886 Transcript_12865/m.25886 type:complete len:416 (+) Transcript_12865:1664-2911(+)